MNLADTDNFLPDHPAQQRHEGRAEVDGQKAKAAAYRQADAAVERPGRAVYRQRKGMVLGVAEDTAAGIGTLITVMGDGKKQAHVAK